MFTLAELRAAAARIYQDMPPTPQFAWPLLAERCGAEIWVKHENHTPAGAFKIRGGITFIAWLKANRPEVRGIITATTGNHGQAQARAAQAAGLDCIIVVPLGNSTEKNAAMRGFGATLIEHGHDFDAAKAEALRLSGERGLMMVPSFHAELVRGVATAAMELFDAAGALDVLYVPVGLGSGICGAIAARDAFGFQTDIVGVVSTEAQGALLSARAGRVIGTNSARTFADGIAVRTPSPDALNYYGAKAARFVAVTDAQIAEAMRLLWQTTHNLAEGAGAAALAALLADDDVRGKRAGVMLTGGNIDLDRAALILGGGTPCLT